MCSLRITPPLYMNDLVLTILPCAAKGDQAAWQLLPQVLRLFRVMTGVPIDYALEQASVLMNCVHRLTFVGVMEKDDTLVWAAHVLAGQLNYTTPVNGLPWPHYSSLRDGK